MDGLHYFIQSSGYAIGAAGTFASNAATLTSTYTNTQKVLVSEGYVQGMFYIQYQPGVNDNKLKWKLYGIPKVLKSSSNASGVYSIDDGFITQSFATTVAAGVSVVVYTPELSNISGASTSVIYPARIPMPIADGAVGIQFIETTSADGTPGAFGKVRVLYQLNG